MKIVADPNIPFVRDAFEPLGDVVLVSGREMNAASVRDARALLVRSVTRVDSSLLAGSQVQFVATATIGTDHVDLDYLKKHGIGFASAAGSNANSVAEYVIAAMLELGHKRRFRLRDLTLGVVGVGNVGRKVVQYATALGMRVLSNDPPLERAGHGGFVPLDRVLAESDIITVHVPLTRSEPDATYHLFGKQFGNFILLNTSRGSVVDNPALRDALSVGKSHGAVLDVWENEPAIDAELLKLVDIGTPHIAGYSFDGKVNGTVMIYQALCRHFGLAADWKTSLPAGQQMQVRVKPGEDDEDVILRVTRQCYQIMGDDAALRWNVSAFDDLRAKYPVRREWFNTHVMLEGAGESLHGKLSVLGFRVC